MLENLDFISFLLVGLCAIASDVFASLIVRYMKRKAILKQINKLGVENNDSNIKG